jgi:hypothetical protein
MRPTPEELVKMSPLDRALSLVHEFKFMVIGIAKTSPNWSRVEDLVKKYGEDDIRVRLQRFAEWRDAGQTTS